MTALVPPTVNQPASERVVNTVHDSPEPREPAIVVRQASHADRPRIERFLQDAYGARARYKSARWKWQFIDNPYARARGQELPVWIALDGERVVGQIAVQRAVLDVEGEIHEAGWAADIMVLRSHRGSGLGHRLHNAVAGEVDILMALAMAQASRRMAERHGRISLTPAHQLTRWVRLDAVSVRRYLLMRTARHPRAHLATRLSCGLLQVHRALPRVVNPLLRLRDLVQRPPRGSRVTNIVEVDRFGSEIDALWERTRSDYPVAFPRDARFLNWRFVDCPMPRYRCFVAERDGQAVGYVILRRADPVELPQGIIVDLYAARQDAGTLDALVRHSLDFFAGTVCAVDCGTSIAELEAVLRKHGFLRTRSHQPTCICRDGALRERLTQLHGDWFLSKADHDWDQIYPADPSCVAE